MARRNGHWIGFVAGLQLLLPNFLAWGQIVVDGSFGAAGSLTGPDFQIGPALGRQIGPNLFHSFSEFNLAGGESATFSGPGEVANILARVSGGNASSIDGVLRSQISGASLFFINPAGVTFGPNATVDITGCFVVTTADYLRLADGGRFEAAAPDDNLLTAAPPAAFGYLDSQVNGLALTGTELNLAEGQSLTLAGGNLTLDSARIQAPGGKVTLLGVQAAGEVASIVEPELNGLAGGEIQMRNLSGIDVGGEQGGNVVIRAGRLTLENSAFILSENSGQDDGGSIDLQASDAIAVINGSEIRTSTGGTGNAGDIRVRASEVRLDGGEFQATRIASLHSEPMAAGAVGDVTIDASRLELMRGGVVSTINSGPGAGGDIEVRAEQVLLDGRDGFLTGFTAEPRDNPAQTVGPGGSISVEAAELQMKGGALISTTSFGSGQGGNIHLRVGQLTVDAEGVPFDPTAIRAQALDTGSGGRIEIEAADVSVLAGAQVNTAAFGSGNGGDIHITAQRTLLESTDSVTPSTLATQTSHPDAGGRAGDVTLETDQLEILGGSQLSTTTFGFGDAGNVEIEANDIRVSGAGLATFSAILANAHASSTGGRGGAVRLTADTIHVGDGGRLLSTTAASGAGGDVQINAGTLRLTDAGLVATSTSGTGNAGDIVVESAEIELERGGRISAATIAEGQAGRIVISAESVLIDDEGLGLFTGIGAASFGDAAAQNLAFNVSADAPLNPRVSINAATLELREGGSVSTSTSSGQSAGDIEIDAGSIRLDGRGTDTTITASTSGDGAGGKVSIRSRRLELISGGTVSTLALGDGDAGKILVTGPAGPAGLIYLDASGGATFIGATTLSGGNGGDIQLDADFVELINDGLIDASSFGAGEGGTIELNTSSLSLQNGGRVRSASFSSGSGGDVVIRSAKSVALGPGSFINTGSFFSSGGNIDVEAGSRITLDRAVIAALAGVDGGNIQLRAGDLVYLLDSALTAEAVQNGGNIRIDPTFVVALRSIISANAIFGTGGNITIISDFFLQNASSITASSEFGVAGSVEITAPDVDLSGSLTPLVVVLLSGQSQLPEHCARLVPGDVSSLIVLGRGGLPIVPGGWLPSLRPPASGDEEPSTAP